MTKVKTAIWKSTRTFFWLGMLVAAFIFVFEMSTKSSTSLPQAKRHVRIFIWSEYTSESLFKAFEEKTGIEVKETHYSSNEEMLAKLLNARDGYDIVIPSDYLVKVMMGLDLLLPLKKDLIPNIRHIQPDLLGFSFDKDNLVSLPYSWSMTGIMVNRELVKESISSYRQLLNLESLKDRISLLDDMREVFALSLAIHGHNQNSRVQSEIHQAKDFLILVKDRVREFTSTPVTLLESGDVLAAQIYANEALRLMARDHRFEFIRPEEGYLMAIDSFAIAKISKNVDEAHELINFLLEPVNNEIFSKELMAPRVTKSQVALNENQQSLLDGFRFDDIRHQGVMLEDLGEVAQIYDRSWTELKAH